MSKKILIDFDVLNVLINEVDVRTKVLAIALANEAIKESKENHYSILEWHGKDEKPCLGKDFLVRWSDGDFSVYTGSDYCIHESWNTLYDIKWAYLSE